MGLFDFLKKNPKGQRKEQPQGITKPESIKKNPVDEGSKSARWVIREAFDKVMQSVKVSDEKKEALFNSFQEAHRSGDPCKEKDSVFEHLLDIDWKWLEYEKWAEIFKQRQQWPYMWGKYESLVESTKSMPENVSDAMVYFKVSELKNILKERNITLKPAPKARPELEHRFKEVISWEEFKPFVESKYKEVLEENKDRAREDLCKLLAHTLTMTIYTLIHYYQGIDLIQANSHEHYWRVGGFDPIEKEFADKFNRGETTDFPPYFPGDRSGLILKYRE